jgi:predicted permease
MTQVALSLVLVIAAGLLIRSFDRLASRPLGFESDRLLVANVDASRVAVGAARLPLYQRIVDTVGAVPGVVHAAGSLMTPIGFGLVIVTVVDVPGAPPMDDREPLPTYSVTPGWFDSYRTSIREGRDIDRRDTATSQSVVLVNEAFVRRFFPSGNAVGGTVTPRTVVPGQKRQPLTVIDVVADAVLASPREVVMPTMYRPLAQWDAAIPPPELSISVRPSTGSPALVAGGVAAAIALVDPDLSFSFRPLGDHVSASIHQERLLALLSAFFGALAILLAAIGLFGVTSYAVARRRTEIGIRMALGAQRGDILRFALGQTILATSGGVVVGLASAAAVTRYLEALLFEITPLDAFTFIAAPAILAAVALIACYLPARRATSIDPMVALRCE